MPTLPDSSGTSRCDRWCRCRSPRDRRRSLLRRLPCDLKGVSTLPIRAEKLVPELVPDSQGRRGTAQHATPAHRGVTLRQSRIFGELGTRNDEPIRPQAAFITDTNKMIAELEDPYILIHEKKLSTLQPLLP